MDHSLVAESLGVSVYMQSPRPPKSESQEKALEAAI